MSLSPEGFLQTFTVYHRPSDFPHANYVVRASVIRPGQVESAPDILGTADTLDQARALIPPEAGAMIPRDPSDHPTVVETWM